MEEGGPPPSMKIGNIVIGPGGAKTTSDPSYKPPPHGGGACITARDCFNFNGTCGQGTCVCSGSQTGTYCQLNRPNYQPLGANSKSQAFVPSKPEARPILPLVMEPEVLEVVKPDVPRQNVHVEDTPAAATPAKAVPPVEMQQPAGVSGGSEGVGGDQIGANGDPNNPKRGGGGKLKRKPKPKPQPDAPPPPPHVPVEEVPVPSVPQPPTMEELYGPGKAYPEPYLAGKLPNQMIHDRYRKRFNRETFLYSVRFRGGPFGLSFDNKVPDGTIVEKLVKNQQAELSDIKFGDKLVAIDHYNTTTANAKSTQRIMQSLPWPRTLVFEARATGEDPRDAVEKAKTRTFNVSVIYPPSMVTEFQIRLADWTPALDLSRQTHPFLLRSKSEDQFCPLYRMKAAEDPFGCKQSGGRSETDFTLPPALDLMMEQRGFVDEQTEEGSPMFAMLLQEAFSRKISIEPRSLAVVKRGVCTFVEKARSMRSGGAQLGIVVNSDNELIDMPAGKEQTGDCSMPMGVAKDVDASLTHLAARTNELWVIVSESSTGMSAACARVNTLAEEIVDRWSHSVPSMGVTQVLQSKPPDNSKLRGVTEEGGRIAISGENGWAFFDYHLAMFGPPEVPLGPHRFQMALPPFGCDPGAYTVRIKDTVVAILRGGGCSFGIKVINAQKLGAKAVIIVNTDDMKTMRLMALPDEVPLITIPCIMVSRRIQFYLEEQLRPYFPQDQHLVSLQPTGVFGEYEKRNSVALPVRLSNQ
eukprot:gene21759-27815_t